MLPCSGIVWFCSCLCGVVCFSVFVNVIVWWCLGGHRAFDAPALDHYLELCGGLCAGVFLIVCSNMRFFCFDACSHVFPGVSVCRCVSLYVSVGLDYVCCIIVRLVSSIACAFLCSAWASRVALVCVMILYDCSRRRCWHLDVQELRQHQLAAAAGVLLLQGARPYLGPNM